MTVRMLPTVDIPMQTPSTWMGIRFSTPCLAWFDVAEDTMRGVALSDVSRCQSGRAMSDASAMFSVSQLQVIALCGDSIPILCRFGGNEDSISKANLSMPVWWQRRFNIQNQSLNAGLMATKIRYSKPISQCRFDGNEDSIFKANLSMSV
jgi:hypothetical protein